MTIAEFRQFCENLGRFASAKERKAPGPKDTSSHKHAAYPITFDQDAEGKNIEHRPRIFACKGCTKLWMAADINRAFDPSDAILIQAVGGQLKLVAGTADSTIIAAAGPTETKGKALVSARLVLNSAKALRGKGDVTFDVTEQGATIRVSTGAEMQLANIGTAIPDWLRAPKEWTGEAVFSEKFWPEAARVFTATTGNLWPYSHISLDIAEGGLRFLACDNYAAATTTLSTREPVEDGTQLGCISSVFANSLRDLDPEGLVRWSDDLFGIEAGPYTVLARLYRAFGHPSFDRFEGEPATRVTADKKVLSDMVRGVASNDEHNRVALVARGAALTVRPYDNPGTSMTVPAKVEGNDGSVGVDAGVLGKCLTAYPGKTVNLGWSPGVAPISLLDRSWSWRMFLAPIVQ